MQQDNPKKLIIITGPTGVGKSDFALSLAQAVQGEIINGDVGQFYAPLSIGTAKPDWHNELVPHHLFDHITTPTNYTVAEYRKDLIPLIAQIQERGSTPIIVGGSGFYLLSLFFPPKENCLPAAQEPALGTGGLAALAIQTNEQLWTQLNEIDPERASAINVNDRYRLERALTLYATTGELPSVHKPRYEPIVEDYLLVQVTRDREELYSRIDQRVIQMFDQGWVNEVASLPPAWHDFLQTKRLIGYPEIIDCLVSGQISKQDEHRSSVDKATDSKDYVFGLPAGESPLIAQIQKITRNYAKRQLTFWRMLEKRIKADKMLVCNLTLSGVDLYLRQIRERSEQ